MHYCRRLIIVCLGTLSLLSLQAQVGGGVGMGTPQFEQNDTSMAEGSVVSDDVKIDPFIATFNLVEGAGLYYDSAQWSFDGIQNYHPGYGPEFNLQTLGDPGTPALIRSYPSYQNPGFRHGFNLYDIYLYNHSNAQYYRAFTPFTKLDYVQMKREYVHLNGIFSINATPGLNSTIRFQTINNIGLYPNQRNSLRQVSLSSRYMGLNNRYYAQTSLNWNRISLGQNGGWLDEEIFDNLSGPNKNAQTRLNNASSLYGDRDYSIEQVYWVRGNYTKTTDTTQYFVPKWGIKHESNFQKTFNRFRATGPDLLELGNIFLDSIQTHDSIATVNNTHRIGVVNYITDSTQSSYYAGIGIEDIRTHFNINLNNNLFVEGQYRSILGNPALHLHSKARTYLSGFNSGDMYIHVDFAYITDSAKNLHRIHKSKFTLSLTHNNRTPALIYHHIETNHHQWIQNPNREQITTLKLGYLGQDKGGERSIQISQIAWRNPVFFNSNRLPDQHDGFINLTEVKAVKGFKLGPVKWLNQITAQIHNRNIVQQIMPMPEWSAYTSLFYENTLFKNALRLRLGIDVFWFSEYFANAYDPAGNFFYIQNRRMQGNYPLIHPFAAIQIKTFRAFVKLEHANFELMDQWFPNLYYSTPGYSLAPQRVVMGVSWKMYQ